MWRSKQNHNGVHFKFQGQDCQNGDGNDQHNDEMKW